MPKNPSADDLLKAIRSHCLDCSGRSPKIVDECLITDCALYPYRTKRELPTEAGLSDDKNQISVFWLLNNDES